MVVVQGVHARMSNGVVLNYAAVDVKKLFDNWLLNNFSLTCNVYHCTV